MGIPPRQDRSDRTMIRTLWLFLAFLVCASSQYVAEASASAPGAGVDLARGREHHTPLILATPDGPHYQQNVAAPPEAELDAAELEDTEDSVGLDAHTCRVRVPAVPHRLFARQVHWASHASWAQQHEGSSALPRGPPDRAC